MKRAGFATRWLPILLLLPQLAIIAVFFYWPAAHAVQSSFYLEDPFGFGSSFVGLDNYTHLASSSEYGRIAKFTLLFTMLVTFFSLALALLLAVKADNVIRGAKTYRTLLMWVYAVAPPVAGFIGLMMLNQTLGATCRNLPNPFGWDFKLGVNYWRHRVCDGSAVSVWKQVPVNFIFFLSGLQSIPKSVREAALIDANVIVTAGFGTSRFRCSRPQVSSC